MSPASFHRRAVAVAVIAAVLGFSLVVLSAVEAQQPHRRYRVGVLTLSASQWQPAVFTDGLKELGYDEGANLTIVVRDAGGRLEALPQLAAELVKEQVDVIVAVNTPGTRAAANATKTIPIVMSMVADPVAMGFVASLARPGGNVTGVSNQSRDIRAQDQPHDGEGPRAHDPFRAAAAG